MRQLTWAIVLLLSAEVSFAKIPSGSWRIDPQQSSVSFTVTKFGREVVEGRFRQFEGTVVYDARVPSRNMLQWRVRTASVQTAEPARDNALRGPSFFDAKRFPEIEFVARRIRMLPDGRIHVAGTITIRGVERPLVVTARPVRIDRSRAVFESSFQLNRHEFGVSGGSVSRHGISDTVSVQLRLVGVPR